MHVFLCVAEFVGGQGIVYPSVCLNSRAIIGSVLLWLLLTIVVTHYNVRFVLFLFIIVLDQGHHY